MGRMDSTIRYFRRRFGATIRYTFKNACKRTYMCRPTEARDLYGLTRNSHAIAQIQRVPYHGPIGYGDQGFWKVFWVGSECGQRHPGAAQNHSLEAWRRHA